MHFLIISGSDTPIGRVKVVSAVAEVFDESDRDVVVSEKNMPFGSVVGE